MRRVQGLQSKGEGRGVQLRARGGGGLWLGSTGVSTQLPPPSGSSQSLVIQAPHVLGSLSHPSLHTPLSATTHDCWLIPVHAGSHLRAQNGLCSLMYQRNCSSHNFQLIQWVRQGQGLIPASDSPECQSHPCTKKVICIRSHITLGPWGPACLDMVASSTRAIPFPTTKQSGEGQRAEMPTVVLLINQTY